MKKLLFFLLFSFVAVSLISCSEDANAPSIEKKVFYRGFYAICQSDGIRPEHSGLFEFSIFLDSQADRIFSESIIRLSSVGMDGSVAFLTEKEIQGGRIFFKDASGAIVPVPIPKSEEKIYSVADQTGLELLNDGEKTIVFLGYEIDKKDGETTPLDRKAIVYMSKVSGEKSVSIIDLNSILQNVEGNNLRFIGKNFLVDPDGNIYVAAEALNFDGENNAPVSFFIIKYAAKEGKVSIFGDLFDEPVQLLGASFKAGKIYLEKGGAIEYMNRDGELFESKLPKSKYSPRQFARDVSTLAVWDREGLSLYDAKNDSKITTVISNDSLGAVSNEPNDILAISPDGEAVVFGVLRSELPPLSDVFSAKIDGSERRLITPQTPAREPSVSPPIEVR